MSKFSTNAVVEKKPVILNLAIATCNFSQLYGTYVSFLCSLYGVLYSSLVFTLSWIRNRKTRKACSTGTWSGLACRDSSSWHVPSRHGCRPCYGLSALFHSFLSRCLWYYYVYLWYYCGIITFMVLLWYYYVYGIIMYIIKEFLFFHYLQLLFLLAFLLLHQLWSTPPPWFATNNGRWGHSSFFFF